MSCCITCHHVYSWPLSGVLGQGSHRTKAEPSLCSGSTFAIRSLGMKGISVFHFSGQFLVCLNLLSVDHWSAIWQHHCPTLVRGQCGWCYRQLLTCVEMREISLLECQQPSGPIKVDTHSILLFIESNRASNLVSSLPAGRSATDINYFSGGENSPASEVLHVWHFNHVHTHNCSSVYRDTLTLTGDCKSNNQFQHSAGQVKTQVKHCFGQFFTCNKCCLHDE